MFATSSQLSGHGRGGNLWVFVLSFAIVFVVYFTFLHFLFRGACEEVKNNSTHTCGWIVTYTYPKNDRRGSFLGHSGVY